MDCPRCGISTYAERNHCPDCGWQLSRSFSGGAQTISSSHPTPTLTLASLLPPLSGQAPPLEPAADGFALSPPQQRERARRHRRRPRWWARLNPDFVGVATLPEDARWEEPARLQVIEMPVIQTAFDFSAAELEAERLFPRNAVAPLPLRFHAGAVDAALILLASGMFFGLFAALGGQLTLGRRDLAIYLAAVFVLTALYFGLFALLGGRTPGMQYFGLRVVGFDGQPAGRRATAWRAFGYTVSLGSLLLGFFWALLDDRQLTWHDHMSGTFLTDRPTL